LGIPRLTWFLSVLRLMQRGWYRRGGGCGSPRLILGEGYSSAQLAHFLSIMWTDLPEQELPGKGLWQPSARPLGMIRIWLSGKDETLVQLDLWRGGLERREDAAGLSDSQRVVPGRQCGWCEGVSAPLVVQCIMYIVSLRWEALFTLIMAWPSICRPEDGSHYAGRGLSSLSSYPSARCILYKGDRVWFCLAIPLTSTSAFWYPLYRVVG
jgi:hypothetical protein